MTFKRETRYLVVKLSDIRAAIDQGLIDKDDQRKLLKFLSMIAAARADAGKPELTCVCIESDWPEYEAVWNALELRITSGNSTAMQDLLRDALRYRFLRDVDNWGEDSEPDSWAALAESHAMEFDELVDRKMGSKG